MIVEGDGVFSDSSRGNSVSGAEAFNTGHVVFVENICFLIERPGFAEEFAAFLFADETAVGAEAFRVETGSTGREVAYEVVDDDSFAVAAAAVNNVGEVLVFFEEWCGEHSYEVVGTVSVLGEPAAPVVGFSRPFVAWIVGQCEFVGVIVFTVEERVLFDSVICALEDCAAEADSAADSFCEF